MMREFKHGIGYVIKILEIRVGIVLQLFSYMSLLYPIVLAIGNINLGVGS